MNAASAYISLDEVLYWAMHVSINPFVWVCHMGVRNHETNDVAMLNHWSGFGSPENADRIKIISKLVKELWEYFRIQYTTNDNVCQSYRLAGNSLNLLTVSILEMLKLRSAQ